MNIWFDLTNSPHVNFFAPMIKDLQKENNVILTARPLANTLDLINLHGLDATIIGKHYGKSSSKKLSGFILRVLLLFLKLRRKSIDIAISHSSFYSPAVAKLLGIPSLYLNDNEHAKGNHIALRYADKIMIPEFLDKNKLSTSKIRKDKIQHYPGVKEGVYLWSLSTDLSSFQNPVTADKKTIYIRPEPWTAQYYRGKHNFLDALLLDLSKHYSVILLPRGEQQYKHYTKDKFSEVKIPTTSMQLPDIIKNCNLFLGAGGTMTREMAVLGVPTISIYQDKLLEVDKYLIKEGCMVHHTEPTACFIDSFLKDKLRQLPNKVLLKKGKDAYFLILETIKKIYSEKNR